MTTQDAQRMPAPAQASGELAKTYAPTEHEDRIWRRWEDARAFHADPNRVLDGEAPGYCILIPPPNVTAALHLGHALNNTLQDVLVRAHRMKGFEALWMPGTDHAGIATQTVVDRRLKERGEPGLAEHKRMEAEGEPGRERFIENVQAWKDDFEQQITDQLKRMGCSCDWDRQRFTMDDVCARAVREAFFLLFEEGLIERGKRLVNWDPVTQTALADDEVEMKEVDGRFYYLRYPLVHPSPKGDHRPVTWGELLAKGYPGADAEPEDDEAWVTVATTRPETYLGDTAVAVNPKDPRAEALRGLRVELPLVGRIIPIIEDDYVVLPSWVGRPSEPTPEKIDSGARQRPDAKAELATGFLKVTPGHDPNDWEIGRRHDLPIVNVMAPDATISADFGWDDYDAHSGAHVFIGKAREQARELVVREFQARSLNNTHRLLEDIKPHRHSVGHSYRSHAPIEPYLSDQWYCRVTDDRLRGVAQRALSRDQRTDESLANWPESAPVHVVSGTGPSGTGPSGTGPSGTGPSGTGVPPVSTELRKHRRNLPHWHRDGSVYFVTFRLKTGELSEAERETVLNACFHFDGDRAELDLATVMPDHVHLIIRPLPKNHTEWWTLSELLHSIKSFSAHEIQQSRGASGSLWQDESLDRIIRDADELREKRRYVMENPVRAGLASSADRYAYTRTGTSRADRRDACPTALDSGDAALAFYPSRYAKTYETWHDNLRDWCISRQLWWGHRIPVWHGPTVEAEAFAGASNVAHREGDHGTSYLCLREDDAELESRLEAAGFTQDPDVLDTWFSSALWPLSTMGWPDPRAAANATGIDDFPQLIDAFNPTSVLCTAREIITLWVSRMVMFNRHFLAADDGTPGPAPFRDVFIHAMIQDGEGRKMSKSLGNGVDPLHIIHTHGADAMRFTLVEMTTQTQDVRMPVELDEVSGKNTSPKFDLGRNFCNKLWNAARFALGILSPADMPASIDPADLTLPDRWMLTRLREASREIDAALNEYQFSAYAKALYDVVRRDFCDWYLEAIKPTAKTTHAQQAALRVTLDALLRLCHPVIPFITEAIYERLAPITQPAIPGFTLAPPTKAGLLATAGWPVVDAELVFPSDAARFERVRDLVDAVRQLRSQHQVAPKQRIDLHVTSDLATEVAAAGGIVEALAGLEAVSTAAPEGSSAAFTFDGVEHHASRLAGQVDEAAETQRLEKQLAELDSTIANLEKRLSNPGYVEKAPEKLVNDTRRELERAKTDRETVAAALERLS